METEAGYAVLVQLLPALLLENSGGTAASALFPGWLVVDSLEFVQIPMCLSPLS